jgi:hypothetical protein
VTTLYFQSMIFVIRSALNLGEDIAVSLFLLTVITGTHVWREALRRHLRLLFTCGYCQRQIPSNVYVEHYLRNTDGKQLSFNQAQENVLYFQQINNAWK